MLRPVEGLTFPHRVGIVSPQGRYSELVGVCLVRFSLWLHARFPHRLGILGGRKRSNGDPADMELYMAQDNVSDYWGSDVAHTNLYQPFYRRAMALHFAHLLPRGYACLTPRNWEGCSLSVGLGVLRSFSQSFRSPQLSGWTLPLRLLLGIPMPHVYATFLPCRCRSPSPRDCRNFVP
jgi:hypothetical protein